MIDYEHLDIQIDWHICPVEIMSVVQGKLIEAQSRHFRTTLTTILCRIISL